MVLSTWAHGLAAAKLSMKILKRQSGSSLNALVEGCMLTESDLKVRTVGLCGWPDREGIVTLDASIMKDDSKAGSVAFVRGIEHPIKLAQLVMEKTPHVMLVGQGAEEFARENGFNVKERPLDEV
jgi:isoaspartyl peptidase/L-asparaginase-like protein (Ntn-hydrolase superfamily)